MENKGSIVRKIEEIFPKKYSWDRPGLLKLGTVHSLEDANSKIDDAKYYVKFYGNHMKNCNLNTKCGRKDYNEFKKEHDHYEDQLRRYQEMKENSAWLHPFYTLGHPAKNCVVHVHRPLHKFDVIKLKDFLESRNWDYRMVLAFPNTKDQDPEILRQIGEWKDKDGYPYINCSVLGGTNYQKKNKYTRKYFMDRTMYTCNDLANIIEKCERIEDTLDDEWTDTQKAMYLYGALARSTSMIDESKTTKNDRTGMNPLDGFITGHATPAGASIMYKELMDRQGIPCELQSNLTIEKVNGRKELQGVKMWNVVTAGGQVFGVDLGEDIVDKYRQEFGSDLQHFAVDSTAEEFYATHPLNDFQEKQCKINGIPYVVANTSWCAIKDVLDRNYAPVVSRESDKLKQYAQDIPENV